MSLLQKFLKKKNPQVEPKQEFNIEHVNSQSANSSNIDLPKLDLPKLEIDQVNDLISNISQLLETNNNVECQPQIQPTILKESEPVSSQVNKKQGRKRKAVLNDDYNTDYRDSYRRIITSAIQGLSVSEVRKALCEVRNRELQSSEKHPLYITDVLSNNMSIDEFCLKFVCGHHNKRHKPEDENNENNENNQNIETNDDKDDNDEIDEKENSYSD